MQHTTKASEAPCRHCRRSLLYAWDEGVLVRADAVPLEKPVAAALRTAGRNVYALTEGGNLVRETVHRYGSLRLVASRHAEHVCPRPPATRPAARQLALLEVDSARGPARRGGGDMR